MPVYDSYFANIERIVCLRRCVENILISIFIASLYKFFYKGYLTPTPNGQNDYIEKSGAIKSNVYVGSVVGRMLWGQPSFSEPICFYEDVNCPDDVNAPYL